MPAWRIPHVERLVGQGQRADVGVDELLRIPGLRPDLLVVPHDRELGAALLRPILFLASDESSYVTGSELVVDGGPPRAVPDQRDHRPWPVPHVLDDPAGMDQVCDTSGTTTAPSTAPDPGDHGCRGRGPEFSATSRRLGIVAAIATVVLVSAYAVVLAIGLLSLESSDQPIPDPLFTILELLIIVALPAIVVLMLALHAWAPRSRRAFSLGAVVFTGMLAVLTCTLHFVVLTLSRAPAVAQASWAPLVLGFRWPSVAYAVDIPAWDVFFPAAMLLAAPVLVGTGLATWIRRLMVASGALAFAGLIGVVVGDMRWRDIGIVGYVPVFLAVALLLGVLFHRTPPCPATDDAPECRAGPRVVAPSRTAYRPRAWRTEGT